MLLKIARGIVKAKGKYYHKGDTVKGLTKALEKELLESGLVIELYEKPLKQSVPPDNNDDDPNKDKVPPLDS